MPLSWACRRQGASAGHTQEAETVSLSQCLREAALSLQTLVQEVLRKPVPLVVKEDNSACIQAVRISVAQLHEAFEERGAERGGDGPVILEKLKLKAMKETCLRNTCLPRPIARRSGVSA